MKDVLYQDIFSSCTFSPHPVTWLGGVSLRPSSGTHEAGCVHKRRIASGYITHPIYSLSRQSGIQGVKKGLHVMTRKPRDPKIYDQKVIGTWFWKHVDI